MGGFYAIEILNLLKSSKTHRQVEQVSVDSMANQRMTKSCPLGAYLAPNKTRDQPGVG